MNIHTVYPISKKDIYVPNSTISADLSIVGKRFKKGSLAISMTVTPVNLSNGATLNIDSLCGGHCFIDNIQQAFQLRGTLPTNNYYARYIKTKRYCNWDKSDVALNKGSQLIGAPNGDFNWMNTASSAADGSAPVKGLNFYIVPEIAINQSAQDLSYTHFGNIKISFSLPDPSVVFYTNNTNPAFTYQASDIKFHYMTDVDNGLDVPVRFDTYEAQDISVVSNSQKITTQVGSMLVDGFVGSFQTVANTTNPAINKNAFENIGITSVSYSFNDNYNSLISFALKDPSEIFINSLAFNTNSYSKFYPTAEDLNNYVPNFGLKMPEEISLENQNLTISLENSNASNINIYNCYLFFSGSLMR